MTTMADAMNDTARTIMERNKEKRYREAFDDLRKRVEVLEKTVSELTNKKGKTNA